MRIIMDPVGFTDAKRPHEGCSDIREAGFTDAAFDLSLIMKGFLVSEPEKAQRECRECGIPYIPDDPDRYTEQLAQPFLEMCEEEALHTGAAIVPGISHEFATGDKELYSAWLPMEKAAVRLAVKSGCSSAIISPVQQWIPFGKEKEANVKHFIELARTAEEAGAEDFTILIKNECRWYEGRAGRGIFSDADTAAGLVDELNRKSGSVRAGICVDTGELNLCGIDAYEYCVTLGERIKAVVIRDNDGNSDDRMAPFFCVRGGRGTDWLSVIRGLRSIHFDGDLIMDASSTGACFPIILKSRLLPLIHRLGQYFGWQIHMGETMKKYDHVVLFGAGNMCRNYMKNYGDEYPPLFTCDNNPARWGEKFCGLTVEPPEKLLDLPENTGIYICNVYYGDIEKQLRNMGITAGIEYFNDEFLDTFYMDRLKGL